MARRPADVVQTRLLVAEAAASASLALVQQAAFWEALTCLALVTETAEARRAEGMEAVGIAICDVLDNMTLTEADAELAVQLLNVCDHAARTWSAVAHPTLSSPNSPPRGAA